MQINELLSLTYADLFRRWNSAAFFYRLQGLGWYSQTLETWAASLGISRGDSVLEVGCGAGLLTAHLWRQGAAIKGVDRSAAMLKMANRSAAEMGVKDLFASGDANALPYEAASFSHVIASSLVNIVPSPHAVLNEMARVTRVGGTVSFLVPSDKMTLDAARLYARSKRLRGFSSSALCLWASRAPKMTTEKIENLTGEIDPLRLERIDHYLDGMVTSAVCAKT